MKDDASDIAEKIEILSKIFSKYNPRIIIVLRDPAEAIPSYFQEIYHKLPSELQKDFELFSRSDYCLAYDYEWLMDQLMSCYFHDINFFLFKDLVANNLTLGQLTGLNNYNDHFITIGSTNQGQVVDAKRLIKKKTLIEILFLQVVRYVPKTRTGIGQYVHQLFNRIRPKVMMTLEVHEEIRQKFDSFRIKVGI